MRDEMDSDATPDRCGSGRTRWLSRTLFICVLISMLMAVGPGLIWVNRPAFLFGIPLVYAWAVFWYFILCLIATVAYFTVWARAEACDEDLPR